MKECGYCDKEFEDGRLELYEHALGEVFPVCAQCRYELADPDERLELEQDNEYVLDAGEKYDVFD